MKRFEDAAWRGQMRIKLDFNNMMREFVGENGFSLSEIEANIPRCVCAVQSMEAGREKMKWRALPFAQDDVVKEIQQIATDVRERFDTFVVLGIGGSALGPMAVHQALRSLRYNDLEREKRDGPKFYVEDNVDPERMASLFEVVDPRRTAFNVITKSGNTSETMSQLLFVTAKLKEAVGEDWPKHIIATTDKQKGNLIRIAKENGIRTLCVPDGVGGRFSELCPVGLLPAAVCGIDIEELLCGAADMDARCSETDPCKNPACMAALLEVMAMERGCNISVMMPYADSLKYMADWYAQLWAESLGKRVNREGKIVHAGQTPVKALGVTDQHSQVQLYTEGPFDKVLTFIAVEKYRDTLAIPVGYEAIPDVAFLGGHTFNELIAAEQSATEYAVQKSGHLNKTIHIPQVNPFTVGQLLCLMELQTAFAGELLNVDAFDQPGVEEGKNATYALLGKQGYDEKRAELNARPEKDECNII